MIRGSEPWWARMTADFPERKSRTIRVTVSRAQTRAKTWLHPDPASTALSLAFRRGGGGVAAGAKSRPSAGRKTAPAPPDNGREIFIGPAFPPPLFARRRREPPTAHHTSV